MDAMNHNSNFADLLNSQQESNVPATFLSQLPVFSEDSSFGDATNPADRRERNKWLPTDDLVLISGWLNTSKDPLIGNEQKSSAFWQRIAAYVAASPSVAGGEFIGANQCKHRWQKIHPQVSKFCGAYAAASRHKTSGQNEEDVLKLAHEIFLNDNQKDFTLDHAWKVLRGDQKWCELSTGKPNGSSNKGRSEEEPQSPCSQAVDDQTFNRPLGVKAAKGGGKKATVQGKDLSNFQSMWTIREKDNAVKERLSKMGILNSIIAKTCPLSEFEESLKNKLMSDMFSN